MSTPHEPLTPEERALAAQLSRLGPQGGPSPQLDARILSAARTAVQGTPVARTPRPRWPLGLGVAASVLLAVGVAWQLRPLQDVPVASEVPAAVTSAPAAAAVDDGHSAMPADEGQARLIAQEDAAEAADAAALPAPAVPPPAQQRTQKPAIDPARRNAEAAARQESAPRRGPLSIMPAVPGLPIPAEAPVARSAAPQAFPKVARDQEAVFEVAAPPAPAPPAPTADATALESRQEAQRLRTTEARQREQSKRAANARQASESRALDAVSVTGSSVRSSDSDADSYGFRAPPSAAAPVSALPPAAGVLAREAEPSAARNALRRTDLQVPVDEDSRLPPAEWLDRIRLRRDLGDAANATRSLQLFVQEHPFQGVPDDLSPLLGEP